MPRVTSLDVPLVRLRNQRLHGASVRDPTGVVRWLGAVQAQEYPLARWGVGQRGAGVRDVDVEAACVRGEILRTHVMRPTWHFVTAADIRWLLALTGARVQAVMASYFRKAEIDRPLFVHGAKVMERALQGRAMTRSELGTALGDAGIVASGTRLAFFTMVAELEAVICSGPRRGKAHTYMLLDERVPSAATLSHDEALAELARRYFTSHGPATFRDCSWWSGLTQGAIRRGVEALGKELECVEVDGLTCWFASAARARRSTRPVAHLLPIYDEFLIAYRDRNFLKRLAAKPRGVVGRDVFNNHVVVDGRLAGTWKSTEQAGVHTLQIAPYGRFTRDERDAVRAAADRYAQFVQRPVTLRGV